MNKQKLLSILKNTPVSFFWIVKKLNIDKKDNRQISRLLSSLVNSGLVAMTKNHEYFKPEFVCETEGIIRITQKGFGFVDLEEDNSVFISHKLVSNALDLDKVKIKVFRDYKDKDKLFGNVIEIIERNTKTIIGLAKKTNSNWFFEPITKLISGNFKFLNTEILKNDYIIKVKIAKVKNNTIMINPILVLGHKNDEFINIKSIIEESNISYIWSKEVLKEAEQIPETTEDEPKQDRKDLTNKLIITIDGEDTKDFDDAIEVRKLSNNNYLLGVHISDVAHYVKEGTEIDNEAKIRGTSVYLADRVIPMLPEKLSNGICSLNPNVDRFTLSLEIEINDKGETIKERIYPGIINSKYRLTYKEVNDFFDGRKKYDDSDLNKMLTFAKELSSKIRTYKLREGYIDFEIKESKLIINDKGKTVDITQRKRGLSEIMIEDFMVRANETVAKYVFNKNLPFIYRVHDLPDLEKISSLKNIISILGLNIHIPEEPQPKDFSKVISDLKKVCFDNFIKIMILRTMQKAIYQKKNIGHFGLASEHYTHFTSPIRRYPDLMVHRMLKTYFFEKRTDLIDHFDSIIPKITKDSSVSELKAIELERKVMDVKKAEYYEKNIGKKLSGQIVSIQKFGFFVEFEDTVNGLVHVTSLTDGRYELSPTGLQLTNGVRKFTIGDFVEVIVVKISKLEGKIDLEIVNKDKNNISYLRRRHG